MKRELVATAPASDLGQWTGYVTDYAGQEMTIGGIVAGPYTTTVKVTLAYPADTFVKPIEVELLRTTPVKVYSSAPEKVYDAPGGFMREAPETRLMAVGHSPAEIPMHAYLNLPDESEEFRKRVER